MFHGTAPLPWVESCVQGRTLQISDGKFFCSSSSGSEKRNGLYLFAKFTTIKLVHIWWQPKFKFVMFLAIPYLCWCVVSPMGAGQDRPPLQDPHLLLPHHAQPTIRRPRLEINREDWRVAK